MEIADGCDPEIAALIRGLNDEVTFAEATREREILRSYGGGCHQKIGVTVLTRGSEQLVSLRGVTDDGTVLESPPWPEAESDLSIWRSLAAEGVWVNGVDEGVHLDALLPGCSGQAPANEGVPCNA
jgi:porphobilinogen deaminase